MTRPSSIDWRTPPPLMAINTAWQPPWLLAAVAEHGKDHYDDGAPVQDAHRMALIGPHVVLALADGVSSQPHSAIGARLAVEAVESYLAEHLGTSNPTQATVRGAMAAAHNAIGQRAGRQGHKTHEYAATLSIAVLTGDHVAAAGVGDSSILAYTESGVDKARRLTPFLSNPQSGGRGIYSISEPSWEQRVATRAEIYPHLKGLLLTSDGANNLFTFDTREPGYQGFDCTHLNAMDETMRSFGTRCFAYYWASYIYGNPANDNDDRTILLAYRPEVPPHFKVV